MSVRYQTLLVIFNTTQINETQFCRVEDRNDPMFHKMRRYAKAFARDDDGGKEKEDLEKGPDSLRLRPKHRGGLNPNRKSLAGWQMIRNSALGLDMEQQDALEDDQDIRYV